VDVQTHDMDAILTLPGVDLSTICTNNIRQVHTLFGVDASTQVLFHELQGCLSAAGRVDEHLCYLMADVITANGTVMSVSRHGLNRIADRSIVNRLTFETSFDIMHEAGMLGSRDPLTDVAASITTGRRIKLGTNLTPLPRHLVRDEVLGEEKSEGADGRYSYHQTVDSVLVVSYCEEAQTPHTTKSQGSGFIFRPKALLTLVTVGGKVEKGSRDDAEPVAQVPFRLSSPVYRSEVEVPEFRISSPEFTRPSGGGPRPLAAGPRGAHPRGTR
jgi:hypothetical protein